MIKKITNKKKKNVYVMLCMIWYHSGLSRGFQTPAYRFGRPNYVSKLKKNMQNKINYLIISSTQMRLRLLRHLI